MRLRDVPLLADENIAMEAVRRLRQAGVNVKAASECGLLGVADDVVLATATQDQRAVLTFDADFGSLAVVQRRPLVGIVYLRPGHLDPSNVMASLNVALESDLDLEAPFLLVIQRTGDLVTFRRRTV